MDKGEERGLMHGIVPLCIQEYTVHKQLLYHIMLKGGKYSTNDDGEEGGIWDPSPAERRLTGPRQYGCSMDAVRMQPQ